MIYLLRHLARNKRGATAIEYGMIVSFVVIAMIAALKGVASTTTGMWNNVSQAIING